MSDFDPNINNNPVNSDTPEVTLPDPPTETGPAGSPPDPPVNRPAYEAPTGADIPPDEPAWTAPETPAADTASASAGAPADEPGVPVGNPVDASASSSVGDHVPWTPTLETPPFDPDRPQYEHSYQPPTYSGGGSNGYEPPRYGQPPSPYSQTPQQQQYQAQYFQTPPPGYPQKSRLAAGLLGILYGCFGVHNFYLGNTTKAVIQLVLSILGMITVVGVIITLGMYIWGFIEGIQILTGKDAYMYDANNVILRD